MTRENDIIQQGDKSRPKVELPFDTYVNVLTPLMCSFSFFSNNGGAVLPPQGWSVIPVRGSSPP